MTNELPENITLALENVNVARSKMVLAITATYHIDQRIIWQDDRAIRRYGRVLMVYTSDCRAGGQLFVLDDSRDGTYWININSTCCPRPDAHDTLT